MIAFTAVYCNNPQLLPLQWLLSQSCCALMSLTSRLENYFINHYNWQQIILPTIHEENKDTGRSDLHHDQKKKVSIYMAPQLLLTLSNFL